MHPTYRDAFNAAYSDGLYRNYSASLSRALGAPAGFRLAETPVFLTREVASALEEAARGIVAELCAPGAAARMKAAIPRELDVPGMDAWPSLLQVDLAIVREADGRLGPRLIELQGFPSLSAFEVFQAEAWDSVLASVPGMPEGGFTPYWSGLTRAAYVDLLRQVVLAGHDPELVVLVDLDPLRQKTYVDFAATRLLLGVDAVCATDLVKEGRRLYRFKDGRKLPVERIYNRVVFDELARFPRPLAFDFRDDLDVEWTPHPNWYWTFSKYSIPLLSHPAVPPARYLSEVGELPADLTERYVLKPLFSFAGGGVNVEPRPEDVARIPAAERGLWCLQEKISYEPFLRAADGGGVKVEVRMMFYRPAGAAGYTLGLNLCRLSRGKMLGVDFNKDFTWVGSSVALSPARGW